jgi:anti-sigma regulatory factor (Ser/Thr protein kinase)
MRLRPRTIRTQLVALLLVPLLSLAGLWTYSTYSSVRDALALLRVAETYRYYGGPTDDLDLALQDERRAAVVYTASQGSTGGTTLARLEKKTDAALAALRGHATAQERGTALSGDQKVQLTRTLQVATDGLGALRQEVRDPEASWSHVLETYSSVIEPGFQLRESLGALQTGQLARQAIVAVQVVRARELISQEDAIMAAARVGGMTGSAFRDFTSLISGRRLLQDAYGADLPAGAEARLEAFENGKLGGALRSSELLSISSAPRDAPFALQESLWRQSVDDALDELDAIDVTAADEIGTEARDTGYDVLLRTGAVSLAGLVLVILSMVVSLRLGRRLVRRLRTLRDEAMELSGNRLPEVMRRLRDGEILDHEAVLKAAPALHLGDDEIGQVGRAFTASQRAAVQAAVEQEKLRRGVSAVFINLARRSQVLLHRQLTLLDAMQRRTQDPTELEDLFRLDHMTTRMRRHAEGLLILSGNSPGRAWRRPVRLAEVVRAAVGEVEDYPRVAVRRMPRISVTGAAVGDVVHLVAELIENAAAFSPPETKVVVRGEVVAGGYVIEVEDRGLGMGPERLAEVNDELGQAAAGMDLPETDRLGLFTVGRLASRQGIRVTLRRGDYGGTAAVVLIPTAILVDAEDDDPETGELTFRPRPAPELTARAETSAPARAAVAVATRAPREPREERTGMGLPKRVRQANLVPQLREDAVHESAADTPPTGADRERSPDEARSTMAAFARGLARGRSADAPRKNGENGG